MYLSNEDFYLDLNNSAEIHKDAVLHCAVDVGEDVDAKLAAFRHIYVGAEGHIIFHNFRSWCGGCAVLG